MTDIGYSPAMAQLVETLCQFDGVGPVTAERMAMQVMVFPPEFAEELADRLLRAKRLVGFCHRCYSFAENGECQVCQKAKQGKRDRTKLIVVASARDVIPVEKTGEYNGCFHVLGGLISPIDGIGPEALHIQPLIDRVEKGKHQEVILLLPPNPESEVTEQYLVQLLSPLTQVSRVAIGLALGSEIGSDTVTLARALSDRRRVEA